MYAGKINLGNPHPANSAGFFSNLTFAWFRKVCFISINESFNINDLYECLEEDKCEALGGKLEKNWNQELSRAKIRNTNPSLLRAIVKTFIWKYLLYSSIFFIQLVIMLIAKPMILEILINLFSLRGNELSNKIMLLYLYGGGLVLVTLFGIIIEHRTILLLGRIGMQLTNACSFLLYGKILRLNRKSLMKVGSGHIINLLSNDIHKLDSITPFLMYLWITPIMFIVTTIFVWNQVQLAGIIGIAFLIIVLIPLNVVTSILMTKWRFSSLKLTDKRITQISEILFGIRTIKMYAWEKPFIRLVKTIRKQEMKIISKQLHLLGILFSSEIFVEKLILFIILVTFVLMGNSLTAEKVFSTSLIINILQCYAAVLFPLALNLGAEGLISIRRLQKILLLEEKSVSSINHTTSNEISFERVSFSWTPQKTVLKDISVNIKPGSLCAIVGPVGSGKSSMLHLLMGELIQDEGNITVGGKTAYCSQKPWLFSSTVRQNILFGQSYDETLYKRTIKVCALEKDLELFPEKDQTIIGEKGIKISGGQKARINLARAVYRKSNIYLLDDPLSALDASVGKEVFENCVMQFLKNKTRLLVTHQLHFLKSADYIIVLNKGKIEAQGTYQELLKINSGFTNSLSNSTEGNKSSHEEQPFESANVYSEIITKGEETEITKSEEFVYWKYIKYGKNNFVLCIAILLLMLGQFWGNVTEFWITAWIFQNSLSKIPSNSSYNDSTLLTTDAEYIYIYAALIAGSIVFPILGTIHFYKHSTWASKNLHKHMLTSLLQTSVEFFDTESSGKMLTRLARDTAIVDEQLPSAIYRGVQTILASIGILIVVLITNPYMIAAVIVLSVPCNKLRRYYSSVSRLIKYLESTTESSVFSYITATFDGVATIRNSEMENVLRNEFNTLRNRTTAVNYLYVVSQSAIAMWIDAICCFLLLFVIFSFIIMVQYNIVNQAYVGLAISQILILLSIVSRGLTEITDGVVDLTSVERILDYTKLHKEEFLISGRSNVKLWPHEGRLRFFNVSLKYISSQSLILKNLNLIINPGEKVGIVGRTGAGKSSLISALFRLIRFQGNIILDDRDIQTVPLEELRSNISVIPQEPILFSGTLRYNLDPHRQFSDEEIYNALGDVQLRDANLPLDYLVNEGGSNFSVGQRQLMCLARAILRKTKILILDEATANVDYKTDELIQETIRRKFKKCTVLTIAHRLNTIMESDKVLVMEEGQIVEFDLPSVLLQNINGYFYKLASETNVHY